MIVRKTSDFLPSAASLAAAFSRRRVLAGALGLGVAVALVYSNTFAVPFLFDDEGSVVANKSIHNWRTAFFPPGDKGDTVSGRPLLNVSLALNYAISGLHVWSYHLVNMLIHMASGLALFGLVRRTLAGKGAAGAGWSGGDAFFCALTAAALWLLHPLQTASVTYIVQRAESLMGMLYLLTLYCFARATETDAQGTAGPGRWRWLVLSAVSCALGMAAKEVMVSAPVMVLLYDRAFVAGSFRAALRARRRFYAALCATWLVLAMCVLNSGFRGGTTGFDTPVTWWIYAITQCKAVLIYLKLVFWPSPLVFDYGVFFIGSPGLVLPQLIIVPLLAAAALAAVFVFPRAGIFGALFFATLAPSSSFLPVVTQTMAEHRMYLPSAAIVVAVVVLCRRFAQKRPRLVAVAAAACAAAVALGIFTWRRNQVFQSAVSIWTDTAGKAPRNYRAQNNAGIALIDAKRYGEGVPHCLEAARLKPGYGPAHVHAGVGLSGLGCYEEAISHFQKAVFFLRGKKEFTHLDNVYLHMGMALHETGRDDGARAAFEEGIAINPKNAPCLNNLGNYRLLAGDYAGAEKYYLRALDADAGLAGAHDGLADALAGMGRDAEARKHYEEAIRLKPGLAQAHCSYVRLLMRLGEPEAARAHARKAIKQHPEHAGMIELLETLEMPETPETLSPASAK